ncbi:biopolymer transport protein ExbD [Sphingomonas jejuensis]|uniref:Biopolymer transport protein ExbD n=1 Tax=Sphingomonas jejuensis TaxID=904715 RepID=A0ABX0XLT6_9SPHN|nr:biopolymer transporter ExbD [Sphingomonas jejuensis]NJC34338.1 biopolymer transport protein ExbD [Sphingomonas jejuensis]
MAMSGGTEDGEPMMEMNTTPLIDVMLVLLIMFIITIPIQTHAVNVDLPVNDQTNTPPPINPVRNKITIDPQSGIAWNAQPVNLVLLRQYLDITKTLPTEPELQIQPDANAPYLTVDQVLAVVRRAEITKLGFVGNEQYREF